MSKRVTFNPSRNMYRLIEGEDESRTGDYEKGPRAKCKKCPEGSKRTKKCNRYKEYLCEKRTPEGSMCCSPDDIHNCIFPQEMEMIWKYEKEYVSIVKRVDQLITRVIIAGVGAEAGITAYDEINETLKNLYYNEVFPLYLEMENVSTYNPYVSRIAKMKRNIRALIMKNIHYFILDADMFIRELTRRDPTRRDTRVYFENMAIKLEMILSVIKNIPNFAMTYNQGIIALQNYRKNFTSRSFYGIRKKISNR